MFAQRGRITLLIPNQLQLGFTLDTLYYTQTLFHKLKTTRVVERAVKDVRPSG